MEAISILGNIGSVEQKRINDKDYVEFSVACNSKKKDGTQTTVWYRVDTSQTSILPYLNKGDKIYVWGRPVYSAYIDKNTGLPMPSVTVFADRTELCGRKADTQQPAQTPQQFGAQPANVPHNPQQQMLQQQFGAQPVQPQQFGGGFGGYNDSNLPF